MTRAPFVNVNDIELMPQTPQKPETGFEARIAPIAGPLGATKLGCRLTVVPRGKKAFPHHVHHVNDELFVILSGEGTLRFGAERYSVRSGDVIVCPAGGVERAHQLINTSSDELRYLSISSVELPKVAEYPDSNKFGVYSVMAADTTPPQRRLVFLGRTASGLDYFDGEGSGARPLGFPRGEKVADLLEQYLGPRRRSRCRILAHMHPCQHLDQPENRKTNDHKLDHGVEKYANV